jgi:putative Holliday junction resolvase
MPRWLGIDWGGRRIGLALSDLDGARAFGYSTLDAKTGDPLREIRRICDEEDVRGIVLGLPLRSDNGEESETAVRIPVVYEDERFTSFAAEQDLKAAGWVPGKDPKALVDKAAARVLLQDHLDRRASGEAN